MYAQLASAVEKQTELQQREENKVHTDVVSASTESQHANLYVYIYTYKLYIQVVRE